jgi:hypothetical protein
MSIDVHALKFFVAKADGKILDELMLSRFEL